MGLVLNGIGVANGIAIGKSYLLQHDDLEVNEFLVPRPLLDEEVARYDLALQKTRKQLYSVRNKIAEHASEEIAGFVDAHLLMLKDTLFVEEPVRIVKEKQCNAEWALKLQRDALILAFEKIDDPYLSARKDDVHYVVDRILRNLLDQPDVIEESRSRWLQGGIVIADEVTPDEIIALHQQGIVALVTEYGGPHSHTAILSRSLGLPTIVGVHHAQHYLRQSDLVIVDGETGAFYIDPDKVELQHFRCRHDDQISRYRALESLRDIPTITQDDTAVLLQCNVELEADITASQAVKPDGVGLLRTEMLFMNRDDLPGEDEQYEFYAAVVRSMQGSPVTIRTLDIGADKHPQSLSSMVAGHPNPALGLRAIRLCLREPSLLLPQLRAILRASAVGKVRIMIPMLTTLDEVRQIKRLINLQRQFLLTRGFDVADNIPLGGMVEVPAAAVMADMFAQHLDFLSIGTNDLIQYSMAADRMDDEVNYLFDPLHPAVLRLILMTIRAGNVAGVPVSMCGEMAGDPAFTRLLLAMGLREFSMQPASLMVVKEIVNSSYIPELLCHFGDLDQLHSSEVIHQLIDKVNNPGTTALH